MLRDSSRRDETFHLLLAFTRLSKDLRPEASERRYAPVSSLASLPRVKPALAIGCNTRHMPS